jgi:hypothetical protein
MSGGRTHWRIQPPGFDLLARVLFLTAALALLCWNRPARADDIAYCPAPMVRNGKLVGWGGAWGPCKHADRARRMEWRI